MQLQKSTQKDEGNDTCKKTIPFKIVQFKTVLAQNGNITKSTVVPSPIKET